MGQAILLGIIQGLTEFLPISSSGHLVLFQQLISTNLGAAFDIMVHLGTLIATLLFFRNAIQKLKLSDLKNLALASIPAGILGLLLAKYLDTLFSNLLIVSIGFVITSIFLYLSKIPNKSSVKINPSKALLIGLAQALAIIPGISRSGSTISTALFQKINQQEAFTFSFLLSIPAIIGALLLSLNNLTWSADETSLYLAGIISSSISGLFALKLLSNVMKKARLWNFAYYTASLALLTFLLL